METTHHEFLLSILDWEKIAATALGILAISFITHRVRALTDRMAARWTTQRLLLLQMRSIAVFALYCVGAWIITQRVWGLSHERLLIFGATLAVALGFALKPIAESIIGGFVLIFDGPFQVGDRVTFQHMYGDIQLIGFRATRLLTLDKTVVTIPNHLFLAEATRCGNAGVVSMMVDMDFYTDLSTDLALAKRLVEDAVAHAEYVDHQQPIIVHASETHFGSILAYQLRAKVMLADFAHEKLCLTALTLHVHERFAEHHIPRPVWMSNATRA